MATFQLQSSSPSTSLSFPLFCSIFTIPTKLSNPHFPNPKTLLKPLNCTNNGALETPKPTRRGRKKQTPPPSSTSTSPTKKPGRPKKQDPQKTAIIDSDEDDMDFPYQDPPLICCFGAAQREFVPTVRVSSRRRHPDIYSTWKQLQWDPPEFVRAPGGPPSNVAISHVRLGGRAAFMGKVGNDEFGKDLVLTMNKESVQTRAVKFDSERRTGVSLIKFRFEDGKMMADVVRDSAEDSLLSSELSIAVLKEVKVFI